jgi:hypothetical protein
MRRRDHETAVFGGKLCIRSGFKWVAATPADLERIERDRAAARDGLAWVLSVSLFVAACLVAVAREVL